jgi:hypothetical protein
MSEQIELVDILRSFIEYRADLQEPMIANYHELNDAIFRAFRPWNVGLADITGNLHATNASEVQTKYQLFKGRYQFTVSYGAIALLVLDPSWEDAEKIAQVIRAGNAAISSVSKAEIARQTMNLSLHLRPRQKNISELTLTFLNPVISSAVGEPVRVQGFSMYADTRIWVADSSALEDNALFLRLMHIFDPTTSIERMAGILAEDQYKFMSSLGLKIAENGE